MIHIKRFIVGLLWIIVFLIVVSAFAYIAWVDLLLFAIIVPVVALLITSYLIGMFLK